jgi:hypothetical protein
MEQEYWDSPRVRRTFRDFHDTAAATRTYVVSHEVRSLASTRSTPLVGAPRAHQRAHMDQSALGR